MQLIVDWPVNSVQVSISGEDQLELRMQETEMMVPTIVCTRASFSDCGSHHEDDSANEKKLSLKQRRIARPKARRNSRRLSIPIDRHSPSSSRSPSPISHSCIDKIQDTIGKLQKSRAVELSKNARSRENISGYGQYAKLLSVPQIFSSSIEWGEPSGDDLSSEWESDQSDGKSISIASSYCLPKVNPMVVLVYDDQ